MSDFRIVEKGEESKVSSPWGNSFCTISEEDIAALREGKVLYHFDGEYGTFIELASEEGE